MKRRQFLLESNLPRDNSAGPIKTMRFETGCETDIPSQPKIFIGLKDPSCLKKLPPKGRNELKSELRLLPNLQQGLSQNRCQLPEGLGEGRAF